MKYRLYKKISNWRMILPLQRLYLVDVKVEQPNISLCWEVSHEESKHKQIDLKNIDKVRDNGALLYLIWEK